MIEEELKKLRDILLKLHEKGEKTVPVANMLERVNIILKEYE